MSLITVLIIYLGLGNIYTLYQFSAPRMREVFRKEYAKRKMTPQEFALISLPIAYVVFVLTWPLWGLLSLIGALANLRASIPSRKP